VFYKLAKLHGFFVIKNWNTCRFLPMGRVKVIHGQLDFTIISSEGRVGFFDCKSYDGRVSYSQINPEQLKRSIQYNSLNVPSGFIANFRDSDTVVLLTGERIQEKGPRSSFGPEDGTLLGTGYDFNIGKVMK
jgi:hypothetical protein